MLAALTGRRLGPLPSICHSWTPWLPAARRSSRRYAAPAGLAALGWRRAKRGYPRVRARSVQVFDPAGSSGFASPLDAATFVARWASELPLRASSSGVAALRSVPGASPPNHYRTAGAAQCSHDAMPRWGTPSGRLRRCCAAPRGRLPPAAGRGQAGAAGACPCPRFAARNPLNSTDATGTRLSIKARRRRRFGIAGRRL